MRNAKEEFLAHTAGKEIKCVQVIRSGYYGDDKGEFLLSVGYTPEQYILFLSSIDWNYDNGYGGQELYGTIWYVDGTWSSRGEYDGSEWWNYNKCPDIPDILQHN